MNLTLFISLAVLTEGVTDYIRSLLGEKAKIPAVIITLALGIAVCVLAKSDLFALFSINLPYRMGCVLSGILLSRGSNYLHALVEKLNKN